MTSTATRPPKVGNRRDRINNVLEDVKAEPGGTQAIDRALAVLFSFTTEEPIKRVPDLTQALGLNKSTVYRLLQALAAADLVRREDETGTYKLGPAVLDLASCFLTTIDLSGDARPILHAFAMHCGESVNLGVLDDTDAISINQVRGSKTPQLVSRLGLRIPVYCSSSGKALVLDHSDEELDELLRRTTMRKLTQNTIMEPKVFLERHERERRQGWTLNDEESEIGMRAIGAPIRDHNGAIIAAVSVSAPTFRLSRDEIPMLAEMVKDVAAEISSVLGGAAGRSAMGQASS